MGVCAVSMTDSQHLRFKLRAVRYDLHECSTSDVPSRPGRNGGCCSALLQHPGPACALALYACKIHSVFFTEQSFPSLTAQQARRAQLLRGSRHARTHTYSTSPTQSLRPEACDPRPATANGHTPYTPQTIGGAGLRCMMHEYPDARRDANETHPGPSTSVRCEHSVPHRRRCAHTPVAHSRPLHCPQGRGAEQPRRAPTLSAARARETSEGTPREASPSRAPGGPGTAGGCSLPCYLAHPSRAHVRGAARGRSSNLGVLPARHGLAATLYVLSASFRGLRLAGRESAAWERGAVCEALIPPRICIRGRVRTRTRTRTRIRIRIRVRIALRLRLRAFRGLRTARLVPPRGMREG